MKIEKISFVPGFINGFMYPTIYFYISNIEIEEEKLSRVIKLIDDKYPLFFKKYEMNFVERKSSNNLEKIKNLAVALQVAVGFPIFDDGKVLIKDNHSVLLIPTLQSNHKKIIKIVKKIILFISSKIEDEHQLFSNLEKELEGISSPYFGRSNVFKFIECAYRNKIHFLELPGGVFQYGVSANSRLLDGSFTDRTSVIANNLVKNKYWATQMMRRSGLPVSESALVFSIETAIQYAHQIGWPVVVKPVDRDGGVGISVKLENIEDLTTAFLLAKKYSPGILIEKYFKGKDYRIVVHEGCAIWAIERVPAFVIGDGVSSVESLIKEKNKIRFNENKNISDIKQIKIDRETINVLKEQDVDLDTVLKSERTVYLKRIANIALGGTPISVFKDAHPDNLNLAIQAANVFGLDLAGIDLLISDIKKSWMDVGASICEVNSQPNLGSITSSHLYIQILEKILPRKGGIPIFVVIGGDFGKNIADLIKKRLNDKSFKNVGMILGDKIILDKGLSPQGEFSLLSGGAILAANKEVDAIVIVINRTEVFRTGFPFQFIDALIFVDLEIDGIESMRESFFNTMLGALSNHIKDNNIFIGENVLQYKSVKKEINYKVIKYENNELENKINYLVDEIVTK